jgi:hypothetical protein
MHNIKCDICSLITFEQRRVGIDKCRTNWLQRSRTRQWGSSIHSDNTGKQQIASSCFMKMTAICMGVDKTFVPFKDSPRPVLTPQEIFKGRSSVTSLQLTSCTQPFKDPPRPVLTPQAKFKGRSSVTPLQLSSCIQPKDSKWPQD